jgi:hypothetical protein
VRGSVVDLGGIVGHHCINLGLSWSYDTWIHNYLWNQFLSPPKFCEFESPGEPYLIQHYVIKVCQWLASGQWFSPGTLVSSTNKTDHHNITEILLKSGRNLNSLFNLTFNKSEHIWRLINLKTGIQTRHQKCQLSHDSKMKVYVLKYKIFFVVILISVNFCSIR